MDPLSQTDLLNNNFHSVFPHQIPMKLSALCEYLTNLFQNKENDMPDIWVTKKDVMKLLQALNISKAAGPYGIRLWVLKELPAELALSLLCFFRYLYSSSPSMTFGNMPM